MAYRRAVLPGQILLQRVRDDRDWWRNYAALAQFARPDHLPPMRDQDRRRHWPRPQRRQARTPAEIPRQRAVPEGMPIGPRTQWGTRSTR